MSDEVQATPEVESRVRVNIGSAFDIGLSVSDPNDISFGVPALRRFLTVLSIQDFGAIPTSLTATDGSDCTEALLKYVEWMDDNNTFGALYFPPGRYHFKGGDDILAELATRNPTKTAWEIWQMTRYFAMVGGTPQNETQGLEQHGAIHDTQLYIHSTTDGDAWLRKHRYGTYPSHTVFGNWTIQNLTFIHASGAYGSYLELGDPAGTDNSGDCRGLHIEGNYFSSHHYSAAHAANGNIAWIENTADGWVYQTTDTSPLVRLSNIYDLNWGNNTLRGGGRDALLCESADCPNFWGMTHTINSVVGMRFSGMGGVSTPGVPGSLNGLYAESCAVVGIANGGGHAIAPRAEVGYDNVFEPDVGEYALPSSIGWDLSKGDSNFVFNSLPVGRTLHDYFIPGQTIRVTPSEAGEPERSYVVTKIDGLDLYFAEGVNGCYTDHDLSNTDGSSVVRRNGQGIVQWGNRADTTMARIGNNELNKGFPNWSVCPGVRPTHFTLSEPSGLVPADHYGEVIKHCAGSSSGIHGCVIMGPRERPVHSCIAPLDAIPPFGAAKHGPLRLPGGKFLFQPGFGEGTDNNQSKVMLYHLSSVDDPLLGEPSVIWALNELDNETATKSLRLWMHEDNTDGSGKSPAFAGMNFTVHAYHPTGGTMTLWDGVSANNITLAGGGVFTTETGTLNAAADLLQVNDMADLEVAWILLEP